MQWCEAMVTHINKKQCVVKKRDDQPTLQRSIVRKFEHADLNTRAVDSPLRHEARLQHWFAATERYPRQLRETDLQTFMQLKRADRVVGE